MSSIITNIQSEYPDTVQRLRTQIKGLRCSISLHGLTMDVLKSALQKYIRRGEIEKGIRCLLDAESFTFAMMQDAGVNAINTAIKAIRTNIMNRLVICALEDCYDPCILPLVQKVSSGWKTSRNTDDGLADIIMLYKVLCLAKKGRYVSIVKLYAQSSHIAYEEKYDMSYQLKPDETAKQAFSSLLLAGDIRCCRFLRSIEPEYAWSELANACSQYKFATKAVKVLHDLNVSFDNKHAEHYYILYYTVFLALHPERVLRDPEDASCFPPKPTTNEVLSMYRLHLADASDIKVDDYIIDMHTYQGKNKGALHFASQGAHIENANVQLVTFEEREKYTQMYIENKTITHSIQLPSPKTKISKVLKDTRQQPLFGGKKALSVILNTLPELGEVSSVQPLQTKTCGAKPMTYKAVVDDKHVVIKKLTTGIDSIIVDRCKSMFGLKSMNAAAYRSRLIIDKDTHDIKSGQAWNIYMVADIISDGPDPTIPASMLIGVRQKGGMYKNPTLLEQYLKIAAFRGIFRVSDFNPRNVLLIQSKMQLVSIDENSAGLTKAIIQRKDTALAKAAVQIMPNIIKKVSNEIKAIFYRNKEQIKEIILLFNNKYMDIDNAIAFILNKVQTLEVDIKYDLEKMIA